MADTYTQELEDLAGLFSAGWGDKTPVAWPNAAYSPKHGATWVRFNVIPGESRQASIGSPGANYFRYVGIVDVQIFTPIGCGDNQAAELADRVIDIFYGADIPGYRFSPGYAVSVGNSTASGWHQKNVRVPYRRDSFK